MWSSCTTTPDHLSTRHIVGIVVLMVAMASMADMVDRDIQQYPHVGIGEAVVDPSPISAGPHHVRGAEQAHCLADHVLAHPDHGGQIAHTQLAALGERMQNRHPRRIAQQPEQLSGLHELIGAGETLPECI